MCSILVVILLGLLIGYIGGYAGIGGAPFLIAALVLGCGISQYTAQGTVLTMMLGPMSLLGIITLKKEVKTQWKSILIGVLSYAVFSYVGAELAFRFGELSVKKYFAFMLVLIGIIQLVPGFSKPVHIEKTEQIPPYWMFVIGLITGIIGGLFGIGAGVLMIPIFLMVFNMKKNHARALSLAILLPPVSLGAFIKYQQEGAIDWKLVIILFISYFIANYFGAKRGTKANLMVFKRIYALLLIGIAIVYFLQIKYQS
jgi:uncharacterized membrane protein YfcA